MDEFSTIKTSRLYIRTVKLSDADRLFYYRSKPEISRFQSWKPAVVDEAETFIKNNAAVGFNIPNTWKQLAICLHNDQMIGDIGLHFLPDEQMEIGYTLSSEYQGSGYATEAVTAVIHHIFSTWKKHRIFASVDPDNRSSIQLLARLGFRKEGHFVKSFKIGEQWYDDCIYAMLSEEWH